MFVPDLVSEEPVSEETDIRVGEEKWFVEDNVSVVTQVSVERVVLVLWSVQVGSCVLIDSELSNESLEEVEGEEVRVVSAWNNKRGRGSGVRNLVVSLEHQGWSEERLF